MNGANIENTGEYAVAGGNLEIIHLCEQNHSAFINGYETAIKYHRNDIFHYLYENTIDKNFDVKELIKSCIKNNNFEILNFLLDENVCIDKNIIQEIIKSSNIFLIKNFDPKELIKYSSLPNACSTGNITYAKYLLKNMKIDINAQGINLFYFVFVLII